MKKIINYLFLFLTIPLFGQNINETVIYPSNRDDVFTSLKEALRNPNKAFHLDLSKKNLTSIPKSINQLINLQSLYLSDNQLTELDIDFSNFPNLDFLELSGNQLTSIPIESIKHCKNLQYLYLRNNKIESIDAGINELKYLYLLDLGVNLISSFPPDIKLPFLNVFKADDNQLTALPFFLLQSTKLRFVNLYGNNISSLSKIKELFRLKEFNIGNNPISSLKGIDDLYNLEVLILDWIKVKDEDLQSISEIKSLQVISLEHCGLTDFPLYFLANKRLYELSLIHNEIESIPEKIQQMKKLRKLWLDNNLMNEEAIKLAQQLLPKCEVK